MTAEHTPAPMIVLKGMSKTFNRTIHAVRDVDLEVAEGEVVVIVGPSGSGEVHCAPLRQPAGNSHQGNGRG
ncbi:MAG: hypothetical protein Ct9H300mP31_20930 [Acidimicrobiaceae bacterium]|nr:MAG: hypothetical protein Ct9H300mP31_20930 [Acidimicrobiaceae bacterium]